MKSHSLYACLVTALVAAGCNTEVDFGEPPRPDYDPLRDANISPRVIETFPPDNSQGPYENFGTVVRLRFNKVMELTTLRQAVHLSSQLGDVSIDPVTIATPDGVTFSFEAVCTDSPARFWWKVGQEYTLRVDSSAHDVNKHSLADPLVIHFLPEPSFRVLEISPPPGATGVSPLANPGFLRISFNSAIDSMIFPAVHISPAMVGSWRLEDPTHLFYHLCQDLELNETYTVSVDEGAVDKSGHPVSHAVRSSFTAQPFQVLETYPLNGEVRIPPTGAIAVRCNAPIDSGSVRASFTCAPPFAGYFVMEERQFYFVPSIEMRTSATYAVTLRTTLRSYGQDSLASAYIFRFSTDNFRILDHSPAHLSTDVPRTTYIYVQCNARIDMSSLTTASFNAYPAIQGTFRPCLEGNCSGFEFYFIPSDSLAPNTFYEIAAGLRGTIYSRTGSYLFPSRWYFRTGDK